MKALLFGRQFAVACMLSLISSCNAPHHDKIPQNTEVSKELLLRSSLVVEAQLIEPAKEGSKYLSVKIKILKIIKNEFAKELGDTVDAVYLSSEDPKFPSGKFIAYLVPYNPESKKGDLKFLEGEFSSRPSLNNGPHK